ncbi:MAG TPA: TIGR01777 family oxidoreductase [Ferruginibacter sp.]|nr:TIGR01777 family oxidoreductase [Ferruginibacter sp.]
MQTVLITGGTGLVGTMLAKKLQAKGYELIILTRKLPADNSLSKNRISYAQWDIDRQSFDIAAIQKADYIIHLAGAGVVNRKWTEAYKKEIQDSRTQSSLLIIDALQKNTNKVKAVISISAIGWYGADKDPVQPFTESDASDNNFLGETCRLWEESIQPVGQLRKRLVIFRSGIVLSSDGGAFAEFRKPLRFGIASILGNGEQVISWIHIDDLCRLFIAGIENEQLSGAYNAVAPIPTTNKALTLTLAKEMRGNFFIPMYVPGFILRLMLGDRSVEVLKSATVSCEKLQKTGFSFLYPTIEAAIKSLNKK